MGIFLLTGGLFLGVVFGHVFPSQITLMLSIVTIYAGMVRSDAASCYLMMQMTATPDVTEMLSV